MLKNIFFELAGKYTKDQQLIQIHWTEIEKKYSESSRHYHTLSHLENIITQLEEVKVQIGDWDPVLFAMFYHDIIYKATRNNNEEKSAELAATRLHEMNFPENKISACTAMILATKKHLQSGNNDTDLFIDTDLSILGQSWDPYTIYFKQIRKEYSIYPDVIYKPARKKVLAHFLEMDRIYKSKYFYEKLEIKAKENLLRELKLLT